MASLKDTSITGTLSVSGAPTFTTAVPVESGGTGATNAATALANLGAQATLVSGTNIKTVGGASILGSGNIAVAGGFTTAQIGVGATRNTSSGSGNIASSSTNWEVYAVNANTIQTRQWKHTTYSNCSNCNCNCTCDG